jgi:hypothetical protein
MTGNPQDGNVNGDAANPQPAHRASEPGRRRQFESVRDGMLVLVVDTRRINEVNPFLFSCRAFASNVHQAGDHDVIP